MTQIIKHDSVDFNALIKNSNATLTLNTQSKMIEILNKEFTEEENRWYIANLYIYMNYHPTNDYPINLDTLVKLVGFAHKKNAKRTLENNFTKDEDYKVTVLPKEHGQFATEQVMLNIDTFKNMCMLVKTEKSKKIRKYYVKLENIYNQIIKEEIENKDKLLEESSKQLEHTKKELQKMSLCRIKKWYDVEPGDTVYAFKNDGEPYIKMGRAENIKKREDGYTVGNRTVNIFYYRKCYDCKLTEKIIHHMLDKYRIEKNREWFDISEELAIYIIDMVCNFLDGFIDCSEEVINLQVNEKLVNCLQQANKGKTVKKPVQENLVKEDLVKENLVKEGLVLKDPVKEGLVLKDPVKEGLVLKEPVKTPVKTPVKIIVKKHQDESLKIHFDKFVKEYCEIGENNKCLALEILGAYRMWCKKTDPLTRKNLTTYMKNNYNLKQEYISDHNTKLTYYIGIKPKEFIVKQENTNILPYYEEFVLSNCKFNYTYRTTKSLLFKEFKKWVSDKYPDYIFSKNDQKNMILYLHRNFCNCKKIHLNGGTEGYYGLQMKNNETELLGISISRRKKVNKIDINTNTIIETYNTLYEASIKLNMDEKKLSHFILNRIYIDNQFIYKYEDV